MSALSCARCATPIEDGDLRCAVCSLLTPARGPRALAQEAMQIVRCHTCGAAVTYRVEHRAPVCRFCGSKTEVETPTDPPEEAQLYLPFEVSPEEAVEAMRTYLRSLGWFRPSDLASSATVGTVTPVYFAAWAVDVTADVAWAADSNAGAGRSAWAPHAGRCQLAWSDVLVGASRGLEPSEIARLAPGYELARALPVDASIAADVERFDVDRSAARAKVMRVLDGLAGARVQGEGFVPGSRFRNVHVSKRLQSLLVRRLALPAYVFVYRYEDQPYRVVVHGRTPSIAFGDAPWSYYKIAAVVAAALAVLGGITAIVLVLLLLGYLS